MIVWLTTFVRSFLLRSGAWILHSIQPFMDDVNVVEPSALEAI